MAADFYIKAGDSLPYLRFQLKGAANPDGSVPNLALANGATVTLRLVAKGQAVAFFEKLCVITDQQNGICEYRWALNGSDTVRGTYGLEIVINNPDNTRQTVPGTGHYIIEVGATLA